MTDDERIQQLKTTPPTVEPTRREQIERGIGWFFSLLTLIALAVGVFASVHGENTSACINTNLGQRALPSQSDALAHIAYAKAQQKLDVANAAVSKALGDAIAAGIRHDTAAQAQATLAFIGAFQAQGPVAMAARVETDRYVATLSADQKARDAHPLGRC